MWLLNAARWLVACHLTAGFESSGEDITVYGDGSQTRSFGYVEDTVDGLIRLMNQAATPDFVLMSNFLLFLRSHDLALVSPLGSDNWACEHW